MVFCKYVIMLNTSNTGEGSGMNSVPVIRIKERTRRAWHEILVMPDSPSDMSRLVSYDQRGRREKPCSVSPQIGCRWWRSKGGRFLAVVFV